MFQLKFNHVFLGLMGLSFISAFAIPQKYSDRVRNVQGLFAPVARPAGILGAWAQRRIGTEAINDHRPDADIRRENDELKIAMARMQTQLDYLQKIAAERQLIGAISSLCTPVPVIGADSGPLDSLSLMAGYATSLREGMAVVCSSGLVGRVERSGGGGAQVRLITDRGARKITGFFGRFIKRGENEYTFARLATKVALLEGAGENRLLCRNLTWKDVSSAQLKPGDWAMLDDRDWPASLAGQRLGQVIDVRSRPDAPQYALVRLEPGRKLSELREVMVVTKE